MFKMDFHIKERIEALIREEISLVPYDPEWPSQFETEGELLRQILPDDLIKRIEHFGSTAIPGSIAKPIIDMLVEIGSLDDVKKRAVPLLESRGYEYLWRPAIGDGPPFYAWFIKRDADGTRTHHIHMVEADSELWDRLHFRDYLREYPREAEKYSELKRDLSEKFPNDRVEYTRGKTEYIVSVTRKAKEQHGTL